MASLSMNISSTLEVREACLEHSLWDKTVYYSSPMTVLHSAAVLLLVVSCVAALLAAHRAFTKVRELPVDVHELHIQDIVSERVAAHWPFMSTGPGRQQASLLPTNALLSKGRGARSMHKDVAKTDCW